MKSELRQKLEALRSEWGYGAFFHEVKSMSRERLQAEHREKRQQFSKAVYQRLFDAQKGVCTWCEQYLDTPAKRNEIDHKNPNQAEGFNDWTNLQLLHVACNRSKSAKSMQQQAKTTGRTVMELLK